MELVVWQVVWRDTGVSPILGFASRQDAGNTKTPREKRHVHSCDVNQTLGSETIRQGDVKTKDRAGQQGEAAPWAQMCARANGMLNAKSFMNFMILHLIHPACPRTIASKLIRFLCG